MKRLLAFSTALALAGCATTGAMKGPHVAVRHSVVRHHRHVAAPEAPAPVPTPAPAVAAPAPTPVPVVAPVHKPRRWLERFESHFHKKGK